jgi:serine/threonine-protein kinase
MRERRIAVHAVVIAVPDSFGFTQPPRIEGGELIWYRERHPAGIVALEWLEVPFQRLESAWRGVRVRASRLRGVVMATFERPKSREKLPADLIPVLRSSGILGDRQLADIRDKVLRGTYPLDPVSLAERLVEDEVLTVYQARRFLNNKPHGLLVGRYIILDRIGSGSMGRVYKAHHQMMDRIVALKIIAPEIASNQKVVARFQREMKLVGRLDHPNVVRAFDADQLNKVLYIVMEYVPGQSLGERLKRGPIPAAEMFEYAAQAALGLAHAHEQGMVHRDVKPSNMLLTADRKIKILDLGLGVLMEADSNATFATADGIAVGTVDYMSPEQTLGRELDGRSDLFSLGCSMFHLMTGKLAYPGESPIDRLGRRLSARPTPITDHIPDFPSPAARVLDKLMATKPQDRYASAREAAEVLQSLLRPKSRSTTARSPVSQVEESPPEKAPISLNSLVITPPASPVALAPQPLVEASKPHYPSWFSPLAAAAERRPVGLLLGLIAVLLLVFSAGAGLGYMLK